VAKETTLGSSKNKVSAIGSCKARAGEVFGEHLDECLGQGDNTAAGLRLRRTNAWTTLGILYDHLLNPHRASDQVEVTHPQAGSL